MDLKLGKTNRGFSKLEFVDHNSVECSLQKSHEIQEAAVWFGCEGPNTQIFRPTKGWHPVKLPEGTLVTTRMHLTQLQVMELLPALICFAATGDLPDEDNHESYRRVAGDLINKIGRI